MLKENIENKPVRLHKKEPLTLEYELTTVIITGAVFIILLILMAFIIGSDNFNYFLWNCI